MTAPLPPAIAEAIEAERTTIANEARRYAGFYGDASDGRNTFILLAEWIEARRAPASPGGAGTPDEDARRLAEIREGLSFGTMWRQYDREWFRTAAQFLLAQIDARPPLFGVTTGAYAEQFRRAESLATALAASEARVVELQREVARLSKATHWYDVDDWDCTYNDFEMLVENIDFGEVMHVGRLAELSPVWAVRIATRVDEDGCAEDSEIKTLESEALAEEAAGIALRPAAAAEEETANG